MSYINRTLQATIVEDTAIRVRLSFFPLSILNTSPVMKPFSRLSPLVELDDLWINTLPILIHATDGLQWLTGSALVPIAV